MRARGINDCVGEDASWLVGTDTLERISGWSRLGDTSPACWYEQSSTFQTCVIELQSWKYNAIIHIFILVRDRMGRSFICAWGSWNVPESPDVDANFTVAIATNA